MSNLPIRTNTSQPSGNSAKPTQANNPANDQETSPFASLLAKQVGEPGPAQPNTAPSATTADRSITPKKDELDTNGIVQDPGSALAITSTDPANTLSAIMLQLPPEARPQLSTDAPAVSSAAGQQTVVLDSAALTTTPSTDASLPATANTSLPTARSTVIDNPNAVELAAALQRNEVSATQLDRNNTEPRKLSVAATAADKSIAAIGMAQDAPKYGELSVTPVQLNHTQANITMAMPGTMPNTPNGSRAGNDLLTVNTPLGSNGWADDFSQQISWMSAQKTQVAELRLNPPNLGPLDVVLTITDKQATVQFSSPHGAVRDAVENALPKLREIFADNGIMLGNTTVSDQTPRERNAAGFMNQGSESRTQRDNAEDTNRSMSLATGDTPVPVARRHIGIVDTFA